MPDWTRSRRKTFALTAAALFGGLLASPAAAQPAPNSAPAVFGVAGRAVILEVHGVGAQIYECKPAADGQGIWTFREPIASLFKDGRSMGRHYAGPSWELTDGGAITGRLAVSLPAASPNDVPLLKLDVVAHRGGGALTNATLVLRLDTHGGVLKGPCKSAGDLLAVPYAADYVFLK